MDMTFTASLVLNWVIAGFLLGIGWIVAGAIYSFVLWVLGQRRPPPAA